MTHTTPQEARETADHLEHMPRLYAGAACNALRSLAAQLEAITAERDAYKQDALRYRRLLNAAYSTDFHDIGLIRLLMNQAALDELIADESIAKALDMPASMWWWVDGCLCKAGNKDISWNPVHDQADSDRMASQLAVDTAWYEDHVECHKRVLHSGFPVLTHRRWENHDGTLESKCAAVRRARVLVAAEIGRAI